MLQQRTVDRLLGDELMRKPEGTFGFDEWPSPIFADKSDFRDLSAPVIAIDNVQEHLLESNTLQWDLTKLPSIAPPFPSFWLDSHLTNRPALQPDSIWFRNSKGYPICPYSYAVFVYAIRIDKDKPDRDDDSVKGVNAITSHWAHRLPNSSEKITFNPDDTDGWYLEFLPFITLPKTKGKRKVIGPISVAALSLNIDGTAQRNAYYVPPHAFPPAPNEENSGLSNEAFAFFLHTLIYPSLFAVGLMHCRNVETVETIPSFKEQKVSRKRNGREIRSYHTLIIDSRPHKRYAHNGSSSPSASTHSSSAASTIHQGLHIVRGHFKTYTDEAPLLGKHTGTWWWDQQLRGDEEYGMVAKDYDVRT